MTSIAQAKAKHRESRLLPCGCRVIGTGANPAPYINCAEADRLKAAAERLCYRVDPDNRLAEERDAAIEAWREHRAQTPVYLKGKR